MIYIASTEDSKEFKEKMKIQIQSCGYAVTDCSLKDDLYENCLELVKNVLKNPENKGIFVDAYGIAPFMVTSKFKGITCALLNDEHSAKMTRRHNNANVMTIGSKVVGEKIVLEIMTRFVCQAYDGGRHQIRVDMLNEMGQDL